MYVSAHMQPHAIPTPETKDPDYALLERVARGDRQALNELIHRHADAMWKVALRISNGSTADAEDAIQEACLACLGSVHTYNKRGSVRSWILAITANEARDHIRKATRRRHYEDQVRATAPKPEPEPDDSVLRDAACASLKELREPFRLILSLRYLDELDDTAIAATLGVSEITVRTRCHRALNMLRRTLHKRGFAVGTTSLISVMAPLHAAAMPDVLNQLITSTCATGKATTLTMSAGSIGVTTSSLWFGGKLIVTLLSAVVIAVGSASITSKAPKAETPFVVSNENPAVTAVTAPPAPAPDLILDQNVTLHLNNIDLDSALTLLRIAIPLNKRPRFIIGFPTRFADFDQDPASSQHELLPVITNANNKDALFAEVSVASKNQPLRTVLDALCKSAELRWWKNDRFIFIDKPVLSAHLLELEQSFQNTGDLTSAHALASCTDSAALRILLVNLANEGRGKIAAQALSDWINKHTIPIPDRKKKSNGQYAGFFKITDAYDRNILSRFVDDKEVTQALSEAIKQKLFSEIDSIYLAGQLNLPGQLERCIAYTNQLAVAAPPADEPEAEIPLHKKYLFALAALGWSENPAAITPLVGALNNHELDMRVRQLAGKLLGYMHIPQAINALLTAAEKGRESGGRYLYPPVPIAAIAESEDPRVIPFLIKISKDVDNFGNNYAFDGLALNGSTEALQFIAKSTKSKQQPIQSRAIEAALLHEGDITDKILTDLLSKNSHEWLSVSLLSDYSSIRKSDGHIAQLKRILLDDTIPPEKSFNGWDVSGHYKAGQVLVALDKTSAEKFLMDNLPDKNSPRFIAFCRVLAGLSERANNVILALADDPDPRLNILAVECLPELEQQGRERLLLMLDNNIHEEVCLEAVKKIIACFRENPFQRYPIPPLLSQDDKNKLQEVILHIEAKKDALVFPVTADSWKKHLEHRFASVRNETTRFIFDRPEWFAKDDWLNLMAIILQSAELRHYPYSLYKVLDNLYTDDPALWRTAVSFYSNDVDNDVRSNFWSTVGDAFNDVPRISRSMLPAIDRRVVIANADKLLLLEAAAKTAAKDIDPHVRAQAGWTLGVALNYKDILTFPEHERLKSQLRLCAQNETDPQVKNWLEQAVNIKPYASDDEKENTRYTFKWPKKESPQKPVNNPPPPEAANDF